jgi:hypothetical protein
MKNSLHRLQTPVQTVYGDTRVIPGTVKRICWFELSFRAPGFGARNLLLGRVEKADPSLRFGMTNSTQSDWSTGRKVC